MKTDDLACPMSSFDPNHHVAARALYLAHSAVSVATTPTVFVVDHDAAVRDALSVSLHASGFGVLAFGSASHFLKSRPLNRKACLLVELDLKDMAGTDLITHLIAEQAMLPTILMSARLRWPVFQNPLPSDTVTVLQKPFGQTELLKSIRLAIGDLD